VGISNRFDSEDVMGSVTPFFATRHGEYVMDGDQEALDEARLRADDLDAEARHAVTFQDFLEELAVLNANEQVAVVNALIRGDKLSRWTIEIITTAAFERAVTAKVKELSC
jgi:hypothetical protein